MRKRKKKLISGRGNAFLINTQQPLALLYNDQSVLENHHIALAFQLTLESANNINIFAELTREEFKTLRQAAVEMVLATDMSRHFEYLTKFQQVVSNLKVCFGENLKVNSVYKLSFFLNFAFFSCKNN